MNSDSNILLQSPLGIVEPNVILAGIEGACVTWSVISLWYGQLIIPDNSLNWQWWYSIVLLVAFVGIILLGFFVEGIADYVEHKLVGQEGCCLRNWFVNKTHPPKNWYQSQRWIWQSNQAFIEFARRRMRILVTRDTIFLLAILGISLIIILLIKRPNAWPCLIILVIGLDVVMISVFIWVWIRAHESWNKAAREVGDFEKP
jgi:hypothetical protein